MTMKDLASKIKSNGKAMFNMKCSFCNSSNIEIRPINAVFYIEDNEEQLKDLPLVYRFNKNIKHISEVLVDPDIEKRYCCNECNRCDRIRDDIDNQQIRKYIKKNKLEKPMRI